MSAAGLTYDEEVAKIKAEKAKPGRACQGLREDLRECLMQSDCVIKDGKSPKDCLLMGRHPSVPDRCHALRQSFFDCKRSLIDMRTRFRGRKGY
ncbi:hypothetical protein CAPTEDRAFT_218889 [Capitella teleta]|uniref:Cytochrome c oxidase assembly factor 5 n=1 Tax=Capitella teleta TaxID=283909 RepID=R7UXK1_CAPTE|nr:hypothetical protein CAPTEDRAFT_218889 [Capitella teleta]|eukprot:ELU08116.1 hypothetical protein CAPTEDRAFT_218889 [Capitella teleta]